MEKLGLESEVITQLNVKEVVKSSSVKILFVSPELLKLNEVIQSLISVSASFVIKCIDEAHLFLSWGTKQKNRKKAKAFQPAMLLSTGELSSLCGITLLQTATATSKSVRLLQDQFPEITNWRKFLKVPIRENVTFIAPPPSVISSKFQDTLEPFIRRMLDFGETHLVLVRSINSGTEMYFYLWRRLSSLNGRHAVAFYHRKLAQNLLEFIDLTNVNNDG